MNKFFKLLSVNLLDLFDINKIAIARKEGVRSNLELRSIIVAVLTIAVGYIIYAFIIKTNYSNGYYYLSLGFLISTIYCFATDLSLIEPVIFNSSDNDILFSYPITKNQIVFSKLFSVYLKNILVVIVIMSSALLAFTRVNSVNETMILMYVICMLFVPFVPIIVCTLLAYVNDYLKIKMKKLLFNIIRLLFFIALGVGFVLLVGKNSLNSIELLINKFNIIYPFGYIFLDIIEKQNILFFFLFIFLNIIFIYLYNTIMSDNIMKICSMLQGVNKNRIFKYRKTNNHHQVFGIVKKEIINLFNNKTYLFSSFGFTIFMFVLVVIGLNVFDIESTKKIENFSVFFNNYGPALLGMINSLSVMTISIMSLEKGHFQILRTMPIGMGKIIFAKWLTNVLLSSVFIVIEAIMFIVKFEVKKIGIVLWFGVPLAVLMLVAMTGLLLDYVFISKREKNDNVIVRQRIIVILPPIISLIVGLLPIFLNMQIKYNYFSGAYLVLLLILFGLEILYMFFNRKKLIDNLFN